MDKTVEYILEVARCGGVAKAARNLFITPSALSKFVIQKEEELGVRLFNRQGNRFTLTYPGERYVEMLRELEEMRTSMSLEMARLADMYSGRLRVGFQMSLADFVTRWIVPRLQDEFPTIRVTLEECNTPELIRRLRKNQLDIILTIADGEEDGLRYDRIVQSPVVIAAAKDTPLKARAEIREGFPFPWLSDEALGGEKLVFDENERSFRKYAGYLLPPGRDIARSDVTVTNARTALMCVRQDLGIIVLPELLVRMLRFQDDVELYSYGKEPLCADLSVVSDPRSALVSEIQNFGNIVREGIQQFINQ